MGKKKFKRSTSRPLPRSVLSSLHEPLLDPKDGHGARSNRDVMILQKWQAAKKGDDNCLIDLVKLIVRENLKELKAARSERQVVRLGGGRLKIRSLLPVMELLRMIRVEEVVVPPERDGYATVTQRKRIHLEQWFEEFALERDGLRQETVEGVRNWMARGAIQRPHRGEGHD